MKDLYAIAYTSKASRVLTSQDLDRLLLGAQAFNEAAQVSGVLLYHAGNFFQFLEGPEAEVKRVYSRILQATTHNTIVELLNAPVSQRQFASWHMAFCDPTESEIQTLETASWEEAIPITRATYARSQGLGLLLYYWSKWKAEPYPNNSFKPKPLRGSA